MSHVVTVKIYDLGATELADISGISLTKSYTPQLNGSKEFKVTVPARSSLLTTVAADGYPNLNLGNRKLVVWEDGDPSIDDPIFHGRVFNIERTGDENDIQVTITAYNPWMELGFEADQRAGRWVRDSVYEFVEPVFVSSVDGGAAISGPDLIQQILTYCQGDPTTDPILGEGPLPIDIVSGTWDLDVPPALDVSPVDSADWPVMVGDFINQLIATNAVDFDITPCRPGAGLNLSSAADDYIMGVASSESKRGTDRSATVHFDYWTGSHNARGARFVEDFATQCDRLWYFMGPRLDLQHWRGDITPNGAANADLLPDVDAAAVKYGGPNTFKGYNAWIRIFDSLGTETSSRPLYNALYRAEIKWRMEPRRLLYITPNPDTAALFEPPQDYDVFDLVQIKTGSDFGVVLDEKQRVHGYTKTWTAEGVAEVSELLTSADVA